MSAFKGYSEAALAWAIPVKLTQLAGHLDAYVATKPSVQALRLCNRYGKGEKALISTLPAELVSRIEEYMTLPLRQAYSQAWQSSIACYEDTCAPANHLKACEVGEILEDVMAERMIECAHGQEDCDCRTPISLSDRDVCVALWYHKGTHSTTERGTKRSFDLALKSGKLCKALRSDFGLEAIIMETSLDNLSAWYLRRRTTKRYTGEPQRAIVCYLALPKWGMRHIADPSGDDEEWRSGNAALVNSDMLTLTPARKKQMIAAMQILGLDVWVHPSQLQGGTAISTGIVTWEDEKTPPDDAAGQELREDMDGKLDRAKRSGWPQLLMFLEDNMNGGVR